MAGDALIGADGYPLSNFSLQDVISQFLGIAAVDPLSATEAGRTAVTFPLVGASSGGSGDDTSADGNDDGVYELRGLMHVTFSLPQSVLFDATGERHSFLKEVKSNELERLNHERLEQERQAREAEQAAEASRLRAQEEKAAQEAKQREEKAAQEAKQREEKDQQARKQKDIDEANAQKKKTEEQKKKEEESARADKKKQEDEAAKKVKDEEKRIQEEAAKKVQTAAQTKQQLIASWAAKRRAGEEHEFEAEFSEEGPLGLTFNMKGKPTLISEVRPGSPAARGSVQVGDRMMAVLWVDDMLQTHQIDTSTYTARKCGAALGEAGWPRTVRQSEASVRRHRRDPVQQALVWGSGGISFVPGQRERHDVHRQS
jgi:chemotaxis protein histidine kinase CheA